MNETLNRYPIDERRVITLHIFNVNKFQNRPDLTRDGSLVDVNNLKKTFGSLKFEVKEYPDLTSSQMKEQFEKLGNEDHSMKDLFFCVIMSHGNRINGVDKIACSNTIDVSLDELLKPIKECRGLIDKPKIVFVQACRGESEFEPNQGAQHTDLTINERRNNFPVKTLKNNKVSPQSIEFNSDYLIVYSTTRNFLSKRDPEHGTPFIRAICKVFEKNVKMLSLLGMINKITKELMASTEQVPELMGSMSRNFYFTKVSSKYLYSRLSPHVRTSGGYPSFKRHSTERF